MNDQPNEDHTLAAEPMIGTIGAAPLGSGTAAIVDLAKEYIQPTLLPVCERDGEHWPHVLLTPTGFRAESVKKYLDEYRDRPERRKGTARFDELDSFIAHTNRMKDAHSAIFAVRDKARPTITTVIDYHELRDQGDAPRFGEHRSLYAPDTSDEWKAWLKADGEAMMQPEFAAFLEDRIVDVIAPPEPKAVREALQSIEGAAQAEDPDAALRELADKIGGAWASPQRLMELSRGMQVHATEKVKNAINLSTGEGEIRYESQHHDGVGEVLKIPNLFVIGIPVFRFGAHYRIAVRLRYRLKGGVLNWSVNLYRPDLTFEHAFGEACDRARAETGLPLYMGRPEGAAQPAA